MNAGIQHVEDYETLEPECYGFSYNWMTSTKRMVDRGWKMFWRKRHMKPPQVSTETPEQMTHADCVAAAERRGA